MLSFLWLKIAVQYMDNSVILRSIANFYNLFVVTIRRWWKGTFTQKNRKSARNPRKYKKDDIVTNNTKHLRNIFWNWQEISKKKLKRILHPLRVTRTISIYESGFSFPSIPTTPRFVEKLSAVGKLIPWVDSCQEYDFVWAEFSQIYHRFFRLPRGENTMVIERGEKKEPRITTPPSPVWKRRPKRTVQIPVEPAGQTLLTCVNRNPYLCLSSTNVSWPLNTGGLLFDLIDEEGNRRRKRSKKLEVKIFGTRYSTQQVPGPSRRCRIFSWSNFLGELFRETCNTASYN